MKVKCKECNKEFTDKPDGKPVKVYEHEGEFICEECFAGRGPLPPHDEKDHDHVVWLYSTLYYGRQI
jgi:hypothetical protein